MIAVREMRQTRTPNVVAMLNSQHEGNPGGHGMSTYREKSAYALEMGLVFVDLPVTVENVREVRNGGTVGVKRWNGTRMEVLRIPAGDIRVAYNFTGPELNGTPEYKEMPSALQDSGTKFINGVDMRAVCMDKWRSQALFDELGVRSPKTAEYTERNAKLLLEENGFIFIKDTTASEGNGQITVSAGSHGFAVKSDGSKLLFNDLGRVFEFVAQKISGPSIVQEGIRMQRINGRVYDLRALFQMNEMGVAVMPAVYVRIGVPGLDQSNVSKGGDVQDPQVFFPNFSAFNAEIEEIGRKIFYGLQRRTGEVGEIGMDFLISSSGPPSRNVS